MHELSDWNRLDTAAFRVSMKRSVRRFAWVAAIIGFFVAVCGLAAPSVPLVVMGSVFVCAAVWNISRPAVTGLIVDGVAMIVSGAFMCLAWVWAEETRPTSAGKWFVAGLVQIVWGIRRLMLYRSARFAPNDAEAIARLEAIVGELSKRNSKTDPTVAEFWTGRFRHNRNRLGLYPEGAIGLLEQQAVRLERRTDIWIEARGSSLGRSMKVRIQMSDLELTGRMSAEHFERFERWKLGMSRPSPVAA